MKNSTLNGLSSTSCLWAKKKHVLHKKSRADHNVQLPDHFSANHRLKCIDKGIIQCLLNTDRHVTSNLSRRPVPVFDHPYSK